MPTGSRWHTERQGPAPRTMRSRPWLGALASQSNKDGARRQRARPLLHLPPWARTHLPVGQPVHCDVNGSDVSLAQRPARVGSCPGGYPLSEMWRLFEAFCSGHRRHPVQTRMPRKWRACDWTLHMISGWAPHRVVTATRFEAWDVAVALSATSCKGVPAHKRLP